MQQKQQQQWIFFTDFDIIGKPGAELKALSVFSVWPSLTTINALVRSCLLVSPGDAVLDSLLRNHQR